MLCSGISSAEVVLFLSIMIVFGIFKYWTDNMYHFCLENGSWRLNSQLLFFWEMCSHSLKNRPNKTTAKSSPLIWGRCLSLSFLPLLLTSKELELSCRAKTFKLIYLFFNLFTCNLVMVGFMVNPPCTCKLAFLISSRGLKTREFFHPKGRPWRLICT